MNYGDMKQAVLGCATRLNSSFQSGHVNLIDIAINNAVINAQRQHDFEWNKMVVSVPCNPTGSLQMASTEDGENVQLKRIVKAYGLAKPSGHGDFSIPYLSRASLVSDTTGLKKYHEKPCLPSVVHDGRRVYYTPEQPNGYVLWFYAVVWMPRLARDTDTNFLFDYGFDYIMYRSLVELNFYLKEDERFSINKVVLTDAWSSLTDWDVSLVSPTETELNF